MISGFILVPFGYHLVFRVHVIEVNAYRVQIYLTKLCKIWTGLVNIISNKYIENFYNVRK